MTKYIIMNKEENRIQIKNEQLPSVLSGQLDLVISMTPVVYTSKLSAKFNAWVFRGKVKKLQEESYTKQVGDDFIWCLVTGGRYKGELLKVYRDTSPRENTYVLSCVGGYIDNLQGDIITYHDFVEVTFK